MMTIYKVFLRSPERDYRTELNHGDLFASHEAANDAAVKYIENSGEKVYTEIIIEPINIYETANEHERAHFEWVKTITLRRMTHEERVVLNLYGEGFEGYERI